MDWGTPARLADVHHICNLHVSPLCSAGTVVFASLDAALRAAAHWQGTCELGDAVAAQVAAPSIAQLAAPSTEQAAQQVTPQAAQPHRPREAQEADAPAQRAPRSPLRGRSTPKPAIVVRAA